MDNKKRRDLCVAVSRVLMRQYVDSNKQDKEVFYLWSDFMTMCCELERESTKVIETKALDSAVRHILDDIEAIRMDLAYVDTSETILRDIWKKLDCMTADLTDRIYWAADIDYRGGEEQ